MPHFLVPLLRAPDRRYGIRVRRTGAVIARRVEMAFDSRRRRQGLLGREGLAPGAALVLAPCSSIHTAFMRFPIDVVFAARDGRVLKVAGDVAPWRARIHFRAFAVIELPAGVAAANDLQRGDVLELDE